MIWDDAVTFLVKRRIPLLSAALFSALFVSSACDLAYPEVVVVNKTNAHVLLKDLSFNGCLWSTVLAYEEATAPGQCLPGKGRIHFKKLDERTYCREQAEDRAIDGVCPCDAGDAQRAAVDEGLVEETPNWFNYQSISVKRVADGDFEIYEITLDDMEQDFSVPGPYGH